MQVNLGMDVLRLLPGVQEHLGELDAVVEVVGASAPLPGGLELGSGHGTGFPHLVGLGVAAAVEEEARAAASGYGHGHAGRGDGVGEGRFLVS